jgi:glycine cleavage system H protein
MNVPANLKYTKDHEWIKVDGDVATIGVTDFAQSQLGDIVFIEIETVGETLAKEEVFGTIEAVKTVSDMFMPVAGEVLEVNPKITEQPDVVNKDPYGDGWMIKIKVSNPAELNELLSPEQYKGTINE